ncbi:MULTISPECIES: peptidase domain protein [Limnospira]|uniref:Peptidase domain protein n=2 Tax=Limnospira TaxID=2596745 RepID=B5W043_LIMMA|nr:peptidase domain protein [Limnospira maxima]EDZ95222.1 peptidase domain protein [Limnospira maxima CS-328]MDC0838431.1 hypothetical protein [Limnoraphis robusta]QJB27018.1 hypothetical protein HFV01_15975 [Limnospira fusiformis SAG 85.79]
MAQTGSVNNLVSIGSSSSRENLNVALYNTEGVLIDTSVINDWEGISLEGLAAGTYHVQVYGDEGAIIPFYSLSITAPWDMSPDRFEPNDSIETATDLGLLSQGNSWDNLSIHPGDSDWFKFDISQTGRDYNSVSISSFYSGENLNIALYDGEGVLIGTSVINDWRGISLEGLEAGTYHVQVYGDEGVIRPLYSLYINPPINITPDEFEPNDSIETATDLGLLSEWNSWRGLSIHAGDSDWFKFEIPQTASPIHYVSVNSWYFNEHLSFALYNADGVLINSSISSDLDGISLGGLAAGTYHVQVYGNDDAISPEYNLYIMAPFTVISSDESEPNDSIQNSNNSITQPFPNQWFGSDGDDVIMGSDSDETLLGFEGDDYLDGQQGNNTLFGGQGNDTLVGGSGRDALLGNKDDDILFGGSSGDTLYGGQGHDTLVAGEGNSLLFGDKGNDILYGGSEGIDTLNGGEGNDTFVMLPGEGYTVVADWEMNQDVMVLLGNATNYRIGDLPLGFTNATAIYQIGETDKIVGIIEGVTSLNLEDSSIFRFVEGVGSLA